MDANGDGLCSVDEFLDFYDSALYNASDEGFSDVIQRFMDVVRQSGQQELQTIATEQSAQIALLHRDLNDLHQAKQEAELARQAAVTECEAVTRELVSAVAAHDDSLEKDLTGCTKPESQQTYPWANICKRGDSKDKYGCTAW